MNLTLLIFRIDVILSVVGRHRIGRLFFLGGGLRFLFPLVLVEDMLLLILSN